jgi:hypothetical protein
MNGLRVLISKHVVATLRTTVAATIILVAFLAFSGCAPRLSPDPFYLDENRNTLVAQANIHGNIQWGRVYWQPDVWIDNVHYIHAVGMHPPAEARAYAEFRIPPGAKYFQTAFGLARQDIYPSNYGHAAGRIFIDNTLAWEGTVSGPKALTTFRLYIPAGAARLRLEVDPLGTNWSDHATWGDAYFGGDEK